MESRFRVRFWPSRRERQPESTTQLDLHSIPYQTAQANDKQPVFVHRALGQNLKEERKSQSLSPLRAFSYRHIKAGKAPTFGGRPQKGNGPVKLQTNRVLSDGEILETTQDSERTMAEIREGEYIVAGSSRRNSRSQSVKSPILRSPSIQERNGNVPLSGRHMLPLPLPPSNTTSSPLLNIPEHTIVVDTSYTTCANSVSPNPADITHRPRAPASQSPNDSAEGLGILDLPPALPSILKKSSKVSLLEPHEEQNPTIRALWKAEYGRLVNLYGQDGVDRNIMDLRRDSKLSPSDFRQSSEGGFHPFVLEPPPRPSGEHRDSSQTAKTYRSPRSDAVPHEDTSDESSKRLSFMSSAAYSSYTSGTSIAESESVTSLADIRRVVDDMRYTYLQALETREPSLQAVKSMKKRKKKKSSTPVGGTPRTSLMRSSLPPSTPEPPAERPVVSRDGSSPPLQSKRSTRTISQPVAGITKLPSIEASPRRDKDPDVGLKRADSATLGALMGEAKRGSIRKRRSKRHSRRLSTQTGPQHTSPHKVSAKEEDVIDPDLANMYNDIFKSSSLDFWQSSPTLLTPVNVPSSLDTASTQLGTSPPITPTKKPDFLL